MQSSALEKLKNLVRISPVLGSAERQEWLSMVDAMNDKQLHDLEKILTAGLSHVATTQPAPVSALPQNPVQPLRPVAAPAPAPQVSPAEKKFREQLDRTVAEPEIEGGEEMSELPAPPPAPPAPVAKIEPPVRPSGISGMPVEPKPIITGMKPPQPPVAPPVVLKPFAPKLPIRPAAPLPPVRPVVMLVAKPPLPPLQAPTPVPEPPTRAPEAGVPKPVPAPEVPNFAATTLPAQGASAGLPATTADLGSLNVVSWSSYSGAEFVAAVQKIMGANGRHATSGAFQTSPLFAAYIQTGLAALSARTGSEEPAKNLLSRAQFEHLTDQLKELHIP